MKRKPTALEPAGSALGLARSSATWYLSKDVSKLRVSFVLPRISLRGSCDRILDLACLPLCTIDLGFVVPCS